MSTRANMRPAARLCSVTCNACHTWPCELCFARPWCIQCSRSSPRPENSYREAAIQVDRRPQKATSGPVAAVQMQTVQVGVGCEQIIGGRSLHHYSDGDIVHVGCAALLLKCTSSAQKLTNAALEW